jgi:hypothetical protein
MEKHSQEYSFDFERGILVKNKNPNNPIDNECRICLLSSNLLYPCNCTSGIHKKCLKRWMMIETNLKPSECEICQQEYQINYGEIFPEQVYNTQNTNVVVDSFNNYSRNSIHNSSELNSAIINERSRLIMIRNQKYVKCSVLFLSGCDLISILFYFSVCGSDNDCVDTTGVLMLTFTTAIIAIIFFSFLINKISHHVIY